MEELNNQRMVGKQHNKATKREILFATKKNNIEAYTLEGFLFKGASI